MNRFPLPFFNFAFVWSLLAGFGLLAHKSEASSLLKCQNYFKRLAETSDQKESLVSLIHASGFFNQDGSYVVLPTKEFIDEKLGQQFHALINQSRERSGFSKQDPFYPSHQEIPQPLEETIQLMETAWAEIFTLAAQRAGKQGRYLPHKHVITSEPAGYKRFDTHIHRAKAPHAKGYLSLVVSPNGPGTLLWKPGMSLDDKPYQALRGDFSAVDQHNLHGMPDFYQARDAILIELEWTSRPALNPPPQP